MLTIRFDNVALPDTPAGLLPFVQWLAERIGVADAMTMRPQEGFYADGRCFAELTFERASFAAPSPPVPVDWQEADGEWNPEPSANLAPYFPKSTADWAAIEAFEQQLFAAIAPALHAMGLWQPPQDWNPQHWWRRL